MYILRKIKFNSFIVFCIGLFVAVGLVLAKPKPQPRVDIAPALPSADIIVVSPQAQTLQVKSQGTVTAHREVDIVAQVAGQVVEATDQFANGGFFEASSSLITIDSRDYEFAVTRAQSKVASAEQILASELGLQRQSKREWRNLGDKQANALFLREPQVASAKAALQAAIADLQQAKLDLDRTKIITPFKGRIWETYVDMGQYVTVGTPIAKVYSTDMVEVRLPLTDRQIALLDLPLSYQGDQSSDPVKVMLTSHFAGKKSEWEGTITRTEASIDVKSRVLYAVAEIPNPFATRDNQRSPLSIGQYVEANITGAQLPDTVTLPRNALHPDNKVWLLDDEDRLVKLPVDVLQSNQERVVVRGEFSVQSRVIVSPLAVSVAGMKVNPNLSSNPELIAFNNSSFSSVISRL